MKIQNLYKVKFIWIIPIIIGIGYYKINSGKKVLFINVTPFISICFGISGTLSGSSDKIYEI